MNAALFQTVFNLFLNAIWRPKLKVFWPFSDEDSFFRPPMSAGDEKALYFLLVCEEFLLSNKN